MSDRETVWGFVVKLVAILAITFGIPFLGFYYLYYSWGRAMSSWSNEAPEQEASDVASTLPIPQRSFRGRVLSSTSWPKERSVSVLIENQASDTQSGGLQRHVICTKFSPSITFDSLGTLLRVGDSVIRNFPDSEVYRLRDGRWDTVWVPFCDVGV